MTNKWRLWHWAALLLGLFELIGIRSKSKDDTLTEYVHSKTQNPAVRGLVGGLAGWLPYHFTYGRGVPLGRFDLVFVTGGIVNGSTLVVCEEERCPAWELARRRNLRHV